MTSEEVTAVRRVERAQTKVAKAKERLAAATASQASTPVSEQPVATLAVPHIRKPRKTAADYGTPLPWSDADNLEHMQLQPEEAFYLLFAIGSLELRVLDVRDKKPAITMLLTLSI